MGKSLPLDLTSGRQLARSSAWNISAQLLPLLIALFCIPLIIDGAGVERFGLLTLTWALIGYASLFDLGLGRALTKVVAVQLVADRKGIPSTVLVGLLMMVAVGLLGSVVLYSLSPWLVKSVLQISDRLQSEAVSGFRVAALAIPLVTLTAGLRGVTEAFQKFRTVAMVNVITGGVNFAGPLIALHFSGHVSGMVSAIVVAKLLALCGYTASVVRLLPGFWTPKFSLASSRSLLGFGSWLTVSNIVGPIMDYMDRFVVGSLLTVGAVVYYATPYDMVVRLRILSSGFVGVLFPAFSTAMSDDRARADALFVTGIRHLLLVTAPPVLVMVIFAGEGLSLWLGDEFAQRGERVVQWIAIGHLINTVALMPFMMLQAAGRPDVPAKIHLLEVPVYLVLLWNLVSSFGIVGAAIAWAIRVLLDGVLLFYIGGRILIFPWKQLVPVLWVAVCSVAICWGAMMVDSVYQKTLYFACSLIFFGFLARNWLLEAGELVRIKGYILPEKYT